MNASPPAVIVLGAGRGSRFGGAEHKLMQPLGQSTVFGHTLRHAVESLLPVVVVTTAPLAELARRSIAMRDVVIVPDVDAGPAPGPGERPLGMGYSIAAGVGRQAGAGGWLVLPGDMPLVAAATIQSVAQALAHHPVVYAQHRGRRGHPVGFSAELFSELIALSGDEGARRLVARYPAFGLEVDDPGVLVDVDTPTDLARLRECDLPEAVRAARW